MKLWEQDRNGGKGGNLRNKLEHFHIALWRRRIDYRSLTKAIMSLP
jgi:hypothetical protein